ncbi:AT-hook motif nuclear-localized protein 8-like protein [Tanacetum coccineum]
MRLLATLLVLLAAIYLHLRGAESIAISKDILRKDVLHALRYFGLSMLLRSVTEALSNWRLLQGAAGVGFTPHVIIVEAGEDIASTLMSFSQQGPRTVSILSASGSISNVTLRQPTSSGGTVTYEISSAIHLPVLTYFRINGYMERISKKRTKKQSQNDKTGHGMEKRGKDKVKVQAQV